MNDDMLMDSLTKLRTNANAARGAQQTGRRRELMISIGLVPSGDDVSIEGGDAHVMPPDGPEPDEDDMDPMRQRSY